MDHRIMTTQALMNSSGVKMMPVENSKPPGSKFGCRSAGCRTLFECLCTCKKCKTECPERAVKEMREKFPQFNGDAVKSGRFSCSSPNVSNMPTEEMMAELTPKEMEALEADCRELQKEENSKTDDQIPTPNWDVAAMERDFTVIGFVAPFVVVIRKSDGVKGSLSFRHNPRVYYAFEPEK